MAFLFESDRCSLLLVSTLVFISTLCESKPVTCPAEYDFYAGGSCFKYVNDRIFLRHSAKHYCKHKLGGQLAVLDSSSKIKKAIAFFDTVFDAEGREGNAPTAWIDGHWLRGTKHIGYGNGRTNRHAHWMTPTRNSSTGKLFKWPNNIFGRSATCLAVSLWHRSSIKSREISGIYNVPCNSIFWTHALCEAKLL